MNGIKVVVISPGDGAHLKLLDRLPNGIEVVIGNSYQELSEAAADADVLVNGTGNGSLVRQLWPVAKRLRWIHSLSAGVETQLFPELVASPIPLTNARGVYKESLGEFVVAAVLFFAKDLRRMLRNQQAGRWEQFDVEVIYRQSLGIIGYGEIGRATARRAKALGMQVYATRRRPELGSGDHSVDRVFGLDQRTDMIAQSDYVVVSAPLTPETRGLVGEAEIAAMKPSAVIVNVGRGPVIEEAALVRALEEKRIRGAALDVFDEEPLPPEHPYWTLDNVLLSPHCADHIEGWLESTVEFFLENFGRFVRHEPLLNMVDKKAGY